MSAISRVILALLALAPFSAQSSDWDFLPSGAQYCGDSYPSHPNWGDWGVAKDSAWIVDINYEKKYQGGVDNGVVLRSPEAGTVTQVTRSNGTKVGWGNSVIWTNESGTEQFHLAHLGTVTKTGTIAAGEQFGTIGSTGNSNGPHLHISRRVKNANGTFAQAPVVLSGTELKPTVNNVNDICINKVTYVSKGTKPATVTKPTVPGNQSATADSSTSITIRWSDNSNNEAGFRVYRWNGSSKSTLPTVAAGRTYIIDSGLSSNTTYRYQVCAFNSAGDSCPSTSAQATTLPAGAQWDGKSPSGTACEKDATTVASRSGSYGKVELRWSSSCKTNWTRIVPNSSSYSTSGKVRRTSDGRSYSRSGTGQIFTDMVYAPTVSVCASGTVRGASISEVCR